MSRAFTQAPPSLRPRPHACITEQEVQDPAVVTGVLTITLLLIRTLHHPKNDAKDGAHIEESHVQLSPQKNRRREGPPDTPQKEQQGAGTPPRPRLHHP